MSALPEPLSCRALPFPRITSTCALKFSPEAGTLGAHSVLACSGPLARLIFPEMWGDCCSRYMAALRSPQRLFVTFTAGTWRQQLRRAVQPTATTSYPSSSRRATTSYRKRSRCRCTPKLPATLCTPKLPATFVFVTVLLKQLVSWFERVWAEAGVNVLVRPYGILPTEPGAGIIEVVQGTFLSPTLPSIAITIPSASSFPLQSGRPRCSFSRRRRR